MQTLARRVHTLDHEPKSTMGLLKKAAHARFKTSNAAFITSLAEFRTPRVGIKTPTPCCKKQQPPSKKPRDRLLKRDTRG
nr:hypothetical protein [uncultured Ralstonia sp.]